ncbi:hypothetical protein HYX05_04640 [Candidatus Woesearchaeota archaeon]|nr:hypothetical protein [Candidatus Woesearchaeota archaeon]
MDRSAPYTQVQRGMAQEDNRAYKHVKIKVKSLFIGLIVFVFLMSTAYAQSKLIFSDIDVKVGSRTSKNLDDGDTINDEADPGDAVEFRVEVKNNFTNAEDLDIEGITVEVTIEGIDDGDDLDDESNDFDLRAGRDKRVNIKFQVPIEVDEDTFDVLIHAEGEDENGTDHEVDARLSLEVDKESHKIIITRNTLSPAEISCSRKNVQAGLTAINIGNEDEEDVTVSVSNSDLGIDLEQAVDELTAEPNEDESRFSNTYSFNVPNDAETGSYPILFRVLYDEDRKKAEETATLTVNDCATAAKGTSSTTSSASEEGDVVVISPTTGRTTTAVVEEAPEGATISQEGFFKSNAFVTGIIIAEVVAVIVGIVLVVSLFRRRG